MNSFLPTIQPLSQRLLRLGGSDDQAQRAVAVMKVLHGFFVHTSPLLGERGFYLLLARALNRAQRHHPILVRVKVEQSGDAHLSGLREAFAEFSGEETSAAGEALVAEFIALIVRFLGADMTVRLVRQSFPNLDAQHEGPISQDNDND